MTARLAAASVICFGFCVAPLANSQTPSPPGQTSAAPVYAAPRTSFGQPSLEGVWSHNFIIVMEDGRIVQRGTHAELLAAGGVYADLYELQSRSDAGASLDDEVQP